MPLAAIAVGFGVALVVVVLAVFQDVVVAVVGWVLHRIGVATVAAAGRFGLAGRWGGRSATTAFGAVGALARRLGGVRLPTVPTRMPRATARPAVEETDEGPVEVEDTGGGEPTRPRARPERGLTSSHRTYVPASSVHVDAAVREFLTERGGAAPLERVVRHLDRQFGEGLGVGLVEAMRNRGVVVLSRRHDAPTRLDVRLIDVETPGRPRG